jgi:hypothetical protein
MLWFKMMNSRGACELYSARWETYNNEYLLYIDYIKYW